MKAAQQIVNALLDGEAPKDFFRRHRASLPQYKVILNPGSESIFAVFSRDGQTRYGVFQKCTAGRERPSYDPIIVAWRSVDDTPKFDTEEDVVRWILSAYKTRAWGIE